MYLSLLVHLYGIPPPRCTTKDTSTYRIGGPSMANRAGVNVLCKVCVNSGDLRCLVTVSCNGCPMAVEWEYTGWGCVGTVVTAATDVDGGVTAGGVVRYGESGSLINTIHQRDLKGQSRGNIPDITTWSRSLWFLISFQFEVQIKPYTGIIYLGAVRCSNL